MPIVTWDELIPWDTRPARQRQDVSIEVRKPWRGVDTETCLGDIMLACDSLGMSLWEPDRDAMLGFLYHPDHRSVWWNIRYDIECFLKMLDRQQIVHILTAGEVGITDDHDMPWRLKWIPKKWFSITPLNPDDTPGEERSLGPAAHHYDASHYYGTHASLDRTARQYYGAGKKHMSKRQVKRFGTDPEAWTNAKPKLLDSMERYCFEDAHLTERLMAQWEGWADTLGLPFDHPISPAMLAGLYAQRMGISPRPPHDHVTRAAYHAYRGGWFDTLGKGTLHTYDADIRSAYPAAMVDLPATDTTWRIARDPTTALDADWGFVKTRIRISRGVPWSPFLIPESRTLIAPRVGDLGVRWVTLDEWRTMRDEPGFTLDFREAVLGHDDGRRPLAWLKTLYEERARMKRDKDPVEAVIKIIINSVYGKMLQKMALQRIIETVKNLDDHDPKDIIWTDQGPKVATRTRYEVGGLFNPITAAYTTARVRMKIWDSVARGYEPVAVATDGILTKKKLPDSFFGPGLGDWEGGKRRKTVIVGNGLYQRWGEKTKARGISRESTAPWFRLLRRDPSARSIPFEVHRPLHPGEVINSLTYTLDDIGAFTTVTRLVDLNDSSKRQYDRKFDARDLLSGWHEGALKPWSGTSP